MNIDQARAAYEKAFKAALEYINRQDGPVTGFEPIFDPLQKAAKDLMDVEAANSQTNEGA